MSIEPETEILLDQYLPIISLKRGENGYFVEFETGYKKLNVVVFFNFAVLVDGCKVHKFNAEPDSPVAKWLESVGIERTDLTATIFADFCLEEYKPKHEIKIFAK